MADTPKAGQQTDRAQRLKAALRANLGKRRMQARQAHSADGPSAQARPAGGPSAEATGRSGHEQQEGGEETGGAQAGGAQAGGDG